MRNLIKLFLLWISSLLHRNRKSKILFYHDIYKTTNYKALDADVHMGTHIELFKRHVDIIRKEGFEIVQQITKPEGQVAIMLDDGFRGVYEVRDFFYENNIFPTIFLPAGHIGEDCLLSKDEILNLQDNGFKFECHSWSHFDLTTFSDEELRRELGESKNILRTLLGKDVDEICLPLGYFSNHLIEQLRLYGYKEVYSSIPGNYMEPVYGGLRTRILCQFSSPIEVKYMLRGGCEMINKRYKKMHYKE